MIEAIALVWAGITIGFVLGALWANRCMDRWFETVLSDIRNDKIREKSNA